MRIGVLATLVAISAPALADPLERVEATGFLGVDDLAEDIGLGGALAPEQRPQTAPVFGARLTYVMLRTSGDVYLDLASEGELSFTSSWTGYGFDGPRESYFAPVLGYRAHLLVRLAGGWLQPHISAGGGGATVVSESPFMRKETDPVFVWGVGATLPMSDRWQLRFDARQAVMEAMDGGSTSNYQLLVSIGSRFGVKATPELPPPQVDVVVEKPPEPDRDSDNDGMPDRLDACPYQAETVNGVEDDDGCPEPDADGDSLVGMADRCPDRAEDFDKFEDDDGCPEDDNDKDGIVDARDACPLEAENKNGISDDDGCVDQLPQSMLDALATASKVKFETNRPRLPTAAKKALDAALLVMLNNPRVKFTITVHPEREGERHTALARKRAEVVKWYLIEQGVAQGSLTTVVGPVAQKKAPLLVLSVTP